MWGNAGILYRLRENRLKGFVMQKQRLFSVTKKDFTIQTFRAGGMGGQNQNKVESGVRIIHTRSGAVGESREFRDQPQNRKAAFRRLLQTKEWKIWFKLQTAASLNGIADIEAAVEREMKESNLRVEYYTPKE